MKKPKLVCVVTAALAAAIVALLASCGEEPPTRIDSVEVRYIDPYPPTVPGDRHVFVLSREELEEFLTIFPARPRFVDTQMDVDCQVPTGCFFVRYDDGSTINAHFCTSPTRLHVVDGWLNVSEVLHEFFVAVIRKRGGSLTKFGAF